MLTGLVTVLVAEWVVGVPWQVMAVQGVIYVMSTIDERNQVADGVELTMIYARQ